MERGNFSAAAGFGSTKGKQGLFATFSAFLEMCISEITMSRLNYSNVLAHFSHSGVDGMADNTCHFGINSMFADGGLTPSHGEDTTRLYFPADQHQFAACLKRIFPDPGLRFLFSNRAQLPDLLDDAGVPLYKDQPFEPGKDYVVREAGAGGGYVVSFGECVFRSLDAVLTMNETKGTKTGLINKPTLNVVDPAMMKKLAAAPWVLVVEGYNVNTGLGSRFGSQLLRAGFRGKYDHIGVHKEGSGGLVTADGLSGSRPGRPSPARSRSCSNASARSRADRGVGSTRVCLHDARLRGLRAKRQARVARVLRGLRSTAAAGIPPVTASSGSAPRQPQRALDHDLEHRQQRSLDRWPPITLEDAQRARDRLEGRESCGVRLGAQAIAARPGFGQRHARHRREAGNAVAHLARLAPGAVGNDQHDRSLARRELRDRDGVVGGKHQDRLLVISDRRERERAIAVADDRDRAAGQAVRGELTGVRGLALLATVHDQLEASPRLEPGHERADAQRLVHRAGRTALQVVTAAQSRQRMLISRRLAPPCRPLGG